MSKTIVIKPKKLSIEIHEQGVITISKKNSFGDSTHVVLTEWEFKEIVKWVKRND